MEVIKGKEAVLHMRHNRRRQMNGENGDVGQRMVAPSETGIEICELKSGGVSRCIANDDSSSRITGGGDVCRRNQKELALSLDHKDTCAYVDPAIWQGRTQIEHHTKCLISREDHDGRPL